MSAGRKNRFGEPSRSITTRVPVSLFDKLGEDPSTAVGDIVVDHFKRKGTPSMNPVDLTGAEMLKTCRKFGASQINIILRNESQKPISGIFATTDSILTARIEKVISDFDNCPFLEILYTVLGDNEIEPSEISLPGPKQLEVYAREAEAIPSEFRETFAIGEETEASAIAEKYNALQLHAYLNTLI